jgi:FlaG/FlaF family flagellin (archaellin)
MEKIIVIAIIVILAGAILVLRLKKIRDKKNPPHSPLR